MTVVVEHFEAYGQCRDSRRIASLEKENAELKDKLKNLESVAEVRLANWQKYEKENAELKVQIEQMKQERSAEVRQRVINEIVSAIEKDREEER